MGVVYEARHEELGRRVAIKLLYPELARQPELLQRFFNEARAANAVQSAALVQVSECSVTPDGKAYLVMEYLPGQTLRSRLEKQKRLPEVDAARVAWQLALALALVHDSNIVHRDLKPGNVMLVPDPADPAGERIKLLDFGVAKFVQKHNQNGGTRTGTRMGTPLYMAPEQCLGTSDLDGKADVYALGVMLFEMLSGDVPFSAEHDLAVLNMHVSKEPPALASVAPRASKEMARLVHRMLAKQGSARPTMAQVAQALRPLAGLGSSPTLPVTEPDEADADATRYLRPEPLSLVQGNGQVDTVFTPKKAWLWGGTVAFVLLSALVLAFVVTRDPKTRAETATALPSGPVQPGTAAVGTPPPPSLPPISVDPPVSPPPVVPVPEPKPPKPEPPERKGVVPPVKPSAGTGPKPGNLPSPTRTPNGPGKTTKPPKVAPSSVNKPKDRVID